MIWTYRKSKLVPKGFVAKIVGGEVAEVLTDSFAEAPVGAVTAPVQGASAESPSRSEEFNATQEARRAEAKRERCASLKANLQRTEEAQRRGGSAATMDRLRENQRSASSRVADEGCGSI